jgi:DNA-binding CsgD family transcriptional regulator
MNSPIHYFDLSNEASPSRGVIIIKNDREHSPPPYVGAVLEDGILGIHTNENTTVRQNHAYTFTLLGYEVDEISDFLGISMTQVGTARQAFNDGLRTKNTATSITQGFLDNTLEIKKPAESYTELEPDELAILAYAAGGCTIRETANILDISYSATTKKRTIIAEKLNSFNLAGSITMGFLSETLDPREVPLFQEVFPRLTPNSAGIQTRHNLSILDPQASFEGLLLKTGLVQFEQHPLLTPWENKVVSLKAAGLTNNEIMTLYGREIGGSYKGIKDAQIEKKLGAKGIEHVIGKMFQDEVWKVGGYIKDVPFTSQEAAFLDLLTKGLPALTAAKTIGLKRPPRTMDHGLTYKKLKIRNRAAATIVAFAAGQIPPNNAG